VIGKAKSHRGGAETRRTAKANGDRERKARGFTAKDVKDAGGTAKLGWPGMRAWKSFGILVGVEGEGASKSKGFLLLLNAVWNRAADYT
jgi:hypothetical protein